MHIVKGLKNIKTPIKSSVLTVGVFDGVHIGHAKIIKEVAARAREKRMKSVVVTFDPHPLKVLNPKTGVPSLISLKHRIRLIGQLGVDYIVILKFSRSVARLPAEKFIKNILVERLGLKEIYVSENFYFGRGARAGIEALKRMAGEFGFKVKAVKPLKTKGDIISSTLIRRLIVNGDIHTASKFLGRPVSVLGTVIRGVSRGRILGFPTANINPHHEAIPPGGVYAVLVRLKDRLLKGVLNIGLRPTFYDRSKVPERAIEVHMFDFDKNIYGEDLEIIFAEKLRDERKFKDRDALISQIKKDAENAGAILRKCRPSASAKADKRQ